MSKSSVVGNKFHPPFSQRQDVADRRGRSQRWFVSLPQRITQITMWISHLRVICIYSHLCIDCERFISSQEKLVLSLVWAHLYPSTCPCTASPAPSCLLTPLCESESLKRPVSPSLQHPRRGIWIPSSRLRGQGFQPLSPPPRIFWVVMVNRE